jgi:DAK2 domain fusion protein YloV
MRIDAKTFLSMLKSGANALDNDKEKINNMNVFPVPDGDTGINMTLTLGAVRKMDKDYNSVGTASSEAASLVLRSARGNSGAILSLFLRGFAKEFKDKVSIGVTELAAGLRRGCEEAYKAVMKPTEGTILTVMRKSAEEAEKALKDGKYGDHNVTEFFARFTKAAEKALAKTPEQLPVLKEVGVVDAGGSGFVTALRGMLAALNKKPVELESKEAAITTAAADFSEFSAEDITFPYCTECVVEKSEKFYGDNKANALHELIKSIGDSVVFIEDEKIIKLHVHTDHPGKVFEKACQYGMLETAKIENMKLQHSELTAEPAPEKAEEPAEPEATVAEPVNDFGFVSVCMGDGISDTFRDLGVDTVIHGGQTMNPSTQDIIDGVRATPAKTVFVLPNNKNIYLVAVQAAKLVSDRDVIVLNTKSVPQGISAMISFEPSVSADENLEAMEAAISNVTSMSITHAVRSTTIDGEAIKDGQIIGLVNGSIDCVANGLAECVEKLCEKMSAPSYVTLFYGSDMNEDSAAEMEAIIREKHAGVEIATISGGQPLYDLIISVE